jgi:hypothetical protein
MVAKLGWWLKDCSDFGCLIQINPLQLTSICHFWRDRDPIVKALRPVIRIENHGGRELCDGVFAVVGGPMYLSVAPTPNAPTCGM